MMLHKSDQIKRSALACLIVCLGTNPAFAINPSDKVLPRTSAGEPRTNSAPLSDQAIDKDLTILENRFFFHHYGHDPVEKRLERIELLMLGATQPGSAASRLTNLKKAVVVKDQRAAQVMREERKAPSYPQVGTLEWKILKKTYPKEALDQRLNRLEEHLFGVPAQAMSYLDRIERLKKTTGIDVATVPSDSGVRVPGKSQKQFGPLPKAFAGSGGLNPFGGAPFFETQPFSGSYGDRPFSDKPFVEEGTDGNGGQYRTFRDGNTFGWSYSTKNLPMPHTMPGQPRALGEMFDDMNRQMNEMMRQFNGVEEMPFPISPYGNFGGGNGIGGGTGGGPGGSGNGNSGGGSGGKNPRSYSPKPFSKVTPLTPRTPLVPVTPRTMPGLVPQIPQIDGRTQPAQREELPPYSDPNSI